jgi:hypothetical protein
MSPLPSHLQNCPPKKDQKLPRKVFRLLIGEVPDDSDFLSFAEMERGTEPPSPVKACRWHGLSVFSDIEDAYQAVDLYPDKQFIASAELSPQHGVAVETPGRYPSHMTWWPSDGIDRKIQFVCVK